MFYDAHNHLQDDRLKPLLPGILSTLASQPIAKMVVNGACEGDWPGVLALARAHPWILPSFGYHPWYVAERSPEWRAHLVSFLDQTPSALGEIGLDKWIRHHDLPAQLEVFTAQWRLAAERRLPVSVHCLQAWGLLFDTIRAEPGRPPAFLLHSFGGPSEMIPALAKLGAYFSLPGYFAHERKARQRETFRHVPLDRLLIETDAPDQSLPPARVRFPLPEHDGKPLNHPANIGAVYEFAAELLNIPLDDLTAQIAANFLRLFGFLSVPASTPPSR